MSQDDPILNAIAQMERPAGDEPKKARLVDSKKNQTEALRACANKDLAALQALITLGLSPNFLGQREGALRSPLSICARGGWSDGVDALLAAGARDGGDLLPEWADKEAAETALVHAARSNDILNFSKIWPLEPSPELRAMAVESGIRQDKICLWLLKSPDKALISLPLATTAFDTFITPHFARHNSDALEAACELLSLMPTCCAKPDLAWCRVFDEDYPELGKALARAGRAPANPEWLTAIKAGNFNDSWRGCAPSELISSTGNAYYGFRARDKAQLNIGPLSRAALFGSERILATLLNIDKLKTLYATDVEGHKCLSYTRSGEAIKTLAAAGLDISLIKDSEGNNPLHNACRLSYGKKNIETLCRVRPEWVDERNAKGLRPIEVAKPEEAQAHALIFDKIGLRDAVKGRKGKRTGEAAKPRRL